jgi:hypothetical protein
VPLQFRGDGADVPVDQPFAGDAVAAAPGPDLGERAARIGEDIPLSAAAGADLFTGCDTRFEEGLAAVIAGIAATLGPRPARWRPPSDPA